MSHHESHELCAPLSGDGGLVPSPFFDGMGDSVFLGWDQCRSTKRRCGLHAAKDQVLAVPVETWETRLETLHAQIRPKALRRVGGQGKLGKAAPSWLDLVVRTCAGAEELICLRLCATPACVACKEIGIQDDGCHHAP